MPKNVERNAEQKQAERNLKLQALERLLAGAGVDPEQDRSFKSIKTRLPGREEQYYSMLDEAAKLVRLMKDPNATAEDLGANFDMLAGETAKYLRGKEQSGAKQPEDFTRALDLLAISRDGGSRTGEIAGSALTEANIKRPSAERVDLKDYGAHRVLGVAKPPEPAREGLDPERNRTVEALERMLTGAAVDVTSDSARTLTERHKGRSRGYVNMLDEAASLCRTLKDPNATPEELQNAGMQLYNFCGQYMRGKEKVRATEEGRVSFDRALDLMAIAYEYVDEPRKREIEQKFSEVNAARGLTDKPTDPHYVKLENYGVKRIEGAVKAWEREEQLKRQLKDCAARLKAKPGAAAEELLERQQSCAMELMVMRASYAPHEAVDPAKLKSETKRLLDNKDLVDFLNENPDLKKSPKLQQQVVAGFLWSGGQLPFVVKGSEADIEAAVKSHNQKIIATPKGWERSL